MVKCSIARFIIIHVPICAVVLQKSVIVRKHNLWAQLHTFVTELKVGSVTLMVIVSQHGGGCRGNSFCLAHFTTVEKKQTTISINLHKHVSHISLASVSLNSVLTAQMELKPKNLNQNTFSFFKWKCFTGSWKYCCKSCWLSLNRCQSKVGI